MADISVEWVGTDKLIQLLATGGAKAVPALARALTEEAQDIFATSQMLVPVGDTGNLQSSGMVHPPSISGGQVIVEISYGGAARAYAEVQHENESYRHDPGRTAKYLQTPFEAALPGVSDNIAIRVEAILKGLI
jgi:hypothetical protein